MKITRCKASMSSLFGPPKGCDPVTAPPFPVSDKICRRCEIKRLHRVEALQMLTEKSRMEHNATKTGAEVCGQVCGVEGAVR